MDYTKMNKFDKFFITSTRTSDLNKLSISELRMASDLLLEMRHGLPTDFHNEEVKIFYEKNTGYVFLSNSKCQVAMINLGSGRLESWYTTYYARYEGFYENLINGVDDTWHVDDLYQLLGLAIDRKDQKNITKIKTLIKSINNEENEEEEITISYVPNYYNY